VEPDRDRLGVRWEPVGDEERVLGPLRALGAGLLPGVGLAGLALGIEEVHAQVQWVAPGETPGPPAHGDRVPGRDGNLLGQHEVLDVLRRLR